MNCKLTEDQVANLHAWAAELGAEVAQGVLSLNRQASMGAARQGALHHFALGFDRAAIECALQGKREALAENAEAL
jgi:hypothetical protein